MSELHTQLLQAIDNNDSDLVSQLVARGAPIMEEESDALLQAVYKDSPDCVREILPYCSADYNDCQAIRVAISMGFLESASVLLSEGQVPSESEDWIYDAAVRAVRNGKPDGIRFILNMITKDPGIFNHIMIEAAEHGCVEILALLVARDFDPTFDGSKALRMAAKRGQLPAVEFLTRYSNKVDITQAFKKAAERGMNHCVEYLMPLSNVNDNHCNAIQMASWCGQAETVHMIAQKLSLEELEDAYAQLRQKEQHQGKTGRSDLLKYAVEEKKNPTVEEDDDY